MANNAKGRKVAGFKLDPELSEMSAFDGAVEWVYRTSANHIVDRKFIATRDEPRETVIGNYLGIFWLPNDLDHASADKSGPEDVWPVSRRRVITVLASD